MAAAGHALVDHHCHSVLGRDLDAGAFAALLTESDRPAAPGTSFLDSQLGFAVRRHCAPVLGLEPHCPPGEYLARRRDLGAPEAVRRLLRAAGLETLLVDTGLEAIPGAGPLLPLPDLAAAAGAAVREVVRLESVAERVAAGRVSARSYPDDCVRALAEAVRDRDAVAVKSVLAYRHGLDVDPRPPSAAETARAAGEWLARLDRHGGPPRLTHPVLLRHLLWAAVELRLPLQLHTGFGDPDLTLHRADPSLLTGFVRAAEPYGVPLVLLHAYPYHRQAAHLAAVYPHVYADVGLALAHTGARAGAVLAEVLETVPFGKVLFSTDAYGLPELYLVGAALFRGALASLLDGWTADGSWCAADADRVAAMVSAGNARRLYGLRAP
ncbi:amidohydrolase [Streptacidiphilus sp. ASG 303]|uniref:amidohydrolase family protein n=1 Tax=Streptacidiphilus sp. ASG 303 TaxID=2896847 RepID=UPI001E4B8EC0|nr:amidohydrolase family protein [Streptacidiphilus sp. ASG 303]MCD0483188.1 amidohydrolase [Streptacidiphilus sp. ASG 303]